jgi:5-methylcytosine-specific restriction endonuclease McrA
LNYRAVEKRADALFRKLIKDRDRWTCQSCGRSFPVGSDQLECAHFIPRGNRTVRWHLLNAAALCLGCHARLQHTPEEDAFFEKRLGKWADWLRVRARERPVEFPADLIARLKAGG